MVGDGEPTLVIAEIGSNHNQKLSQAKQLIDAAAKAGVDAVKFQLFKAEVLYPNRDTYYDIMKANELPREWVTELATYAKQHNLLFMASPFDYEAIDILDELETPALKLASSEAVNWPLVQYAASKKRPLIVSTGMCDLADVSQLVELVRNTANNEDVILLQCTALYPPEPRQVNLRAMETMRNAFHLLIGFSDHTPGITISVAAVARGACIIEKHLTLNRGMEGPDHAYALEPDEMGTLVKSIRTVEASLGSPVKDMLTSERSVARRESVTATIDIPKSTKITRDMLVCSRPAIGIKPKFVEAVIGSSSNQDINAGQALTWDMLNVRSRGD